MKKAFLITLLFLTPQAAFSASSIDFTKVNTVIATILNEAIQTEQFKDSQGRDMLDFATLAFRTAETDLDKGNIAADFSLGLNGSLWAPGEKSQLKASVTAVTKNQATDPLMELSAELALQTQVVALVRYGSAKILAEEDPCSDAAITQAGEPNETAFRQAACDEFRLFPKVADFSALVTGLEKIAVARSAFVEKRLVELANSNETWKLQSLLEEKKYLAAVLKGFKEKTSTSLKITTEEKIAVAGGTEVTKIYVALAPNSLSIGINGTSPEAPRLVEGFKPGIEGFAEALSRADSDPEKIEVVRNIQSALRDLVELSKEWIIE